MARALEEDRSAVRRNVEAYEKKPAPAVDVALNAQPRLLTISRQIPRHSLHTFAGPVTTVLLSSLRF